MRKSTHDHLVSSYEATVPDDAGLLHDRVHTESGPARPGRTTKVDAGGAAKADTGKAQLSLIPVEALNEMAKALAYGAQKYGRNNFKRGHAYSRVLDAALRHLNAMASGELIDAESGNTHLSHALASLAMLAYHVAHHPNLNDLGDK